jgi:hypothetical protein
MRAHLIAALGLQHQSGAFGHAPPGTSLEANGSSPWLTIQPTLSCCAAAPAARST